ncbi:MAG: FAD:protein FMN transferase [Algicola sp.]|nr:FAD:protein FMN transferase [Algicola sp.]
MKYLTFFVLLVMVFSCETDLENTKLSGPVFGTSYTIIYDGEMDYTEQIDSLFETVNQSLSTYIPNSDISKINRNEPTAIDEHFKLVLDASKRIHKATNGAFDPTIGIVVNAWDFGPEGKIVELDSMKIDSMMQYVGFDKVNRVDDKVLKMQGAFLDFNAIAKGYGVDVIGTFLESQGIQNYLVEIGGEIRVKGQNLEKGSPWKVGLDEPRFDGEQSVYKAISLKDEAMATSGTYRKFKVDDQGNRYAHIINTETGYPTKTNVLSVSVIAEDCMTADAYATAFQAMGIEKVSSFLETHPDIKVFFIYENDDKALETLSSNNFPKD